MNCPLLRRALSATLSLLLAACGSDSDIIQSRYATADEVKRDRAIERGWLPEVLPASAKDISENHNLDLNIGSGSFSFSHTEAESFRARLRPLPPTEPVRGIIIDRAKYERQGFSFYSFENFYIAVNWTTCKVHFWIVPEGASKAA